MLEILRHKFNQHKRILRTIIFCPIIVQKNWEREIAQYTKIPREKYFSLEGSGLQKCNLFDKEAFNISAELEKDMVLGKIFIVNYELLLNDEFIESLNEWKPEVLILDEAHRCARITAERTKKMIKISQAMHDRKLKHQAVSYKYILTGTPILKNQLDLYAQFMILDCGQSLGTNFFQYRAKFFYDKNAGMPKHKYFPNWLPRKDMEPVLTRIIADKSITVKKQDCLDLPPLVREKVFVDMSTPQKKVYDAMKKDLVAYLDSGQAVVATLALTKALRLQQILSGFYVTDANETHRFEKVPRLDALMEKIEDLSPSHKIIVWCVFKENYQAVGDRLKEKGIKYVELHGEVKAKDKYANVDAFNNDEEVRVLIGNPAAAGEGVNLISASISIWFSRNFSMVQDVQAEARNYRGGSERHEKVTRIDIITPNSLDEHIIESVENKYDLSKNLLDFKRILNTL